MGKKTVYPGRAAAVAALERAAAKEIKAYFEDWTEYDKPDLLDTEKTPDGVTRYLLTRTCGSYLLNPEERAEIAAQILEYYQTSDPSLRKLRRIEISADRVTVETVDPARTLAAWAKLANEIRNETRAA